MDRGPLGDDIDRFVDTVSADLGELSGKPAESHRADVVIEASSIVAAAFDADGRLSDDESWAYVSGIGVISEPAMIGTPAEMRASGVLTGKANWAATPSVLFDLLVRADARHGTQRCHRYHDRALRLVRACASVDLVATPSELDHIETFRHTLLRAMDAAAVPRPGRGPGRPVSTDPGPAAAQIPIAPTAPTLKTPDLKTPEPKTLEPKTLDLKTPGSSLPPARTITDLIAELDALVGLDTVKDEISRLTSLLQIQALRAERGLPTIETSHHLIFTGNPGTGKTTVARLLSQIYRSVGVVSNGHLVETDRSALVAGFVGQTATKTMAVLQSAIGGMLLIDEAYSLARGGADDFGREAIDTLVKFMEDHRDDIGIVAAGYPAEMQDFVDTNPGLKSRFTRTVNFSDYTDDELVTIFDRLGEKNHYVLTDDATTKLRALLAATSRDRGFGNARLIRNVFEEAVGRQAQRLAPWEEPTNEQLTTLTADDLPAVGAPR